MSFRLVLVCLGLYFGLPAVAFADPVVVKVVPLHERIYPGEQFPIAVIIQHDPGYHTWPAQDVLPADVAAAVTDNRTAIEVTSSPPWATRIAPTQYPQPHPGKVANPSGGDPITVPLYEGTVIGFVPVIVKPDAKPGKATLTIAVRYQTCDDKQCLPREDLTLDVTFEIVPGPLAPGDARASSDPALFATFDQASFAATDAQGGAPSSKPLVFRFFQWTITINPDGTVGFVLLLLLAGLGGALLNFTPCVLPVIPIKIIGLSQSAGNPARCFFLGLMLSAGVVFFWLLIGAAMAFISGFGAINTLFQYPAFPMAIGVFMLLMAVGMLGAYAIRLPDWVYSVNPSHDSAKGSFGFGIMTAVLSTPCTAPFMGTAATWAAGKPATITLCTFLAIGVGMALPYLILSANPNWLKHMPKSGPGSELLKQVMGLFILAVAAFFLGIGLSALLTSPPDPPTLVYWWLVGGLIAAAGVWLCIGTVRISRSAVKRTVFGVIGIGLAAVGYILARDLTDRGPIKWVYYTPERFAAAQASGKVIVMDFTADWCLNCKAIEASVLHTDGIVRLLHSDGVMPMKVDLTANNPAGKAKLKELNWVGIPLLATFGPGLAEPIKYDSYTPSMVEEAVAKARAKASPRRAVAPP